TTTTTTPEGPTTNTTKPGKPGDSGTTTSNGGRKTFLPKTGEAVATGVILIGVAILSGAVILKRKISNN
ncbi:LPXTG cell wall anchor domain-containing protein, partial [Streptococcus sp. SM3]